MQREKYDVVVVGSGMGGMCSGALLVKEGYKTLVVESRQRLGGRFSTVEKDGFKMATGAIYVHMSGWVPKVMKELGIKNVELREVPELIYRRGGKDYSLTGKGRIRALLDILSETDVQRAKLVGALAKEVAGEKIMNAFRQAVSQPKKHKSALTVREWLLQYTDDQDVHDIFDLYSVGFGLAHNWELPATELFALMAGTGGVSDAWMLPQGNVVLMEEMAKIVKTNGDVWTECPAKRIVVNKGTATGVVVEKDGKEVEIACKVVVSNVGPKATVELAGSENFNEEYLKEMRMKLRPQPFVLIYVASDKPLCLEEGQHGAFMVTGTRRITGGQPMTNTCPELAPPGQHLLYTWGFPTSTLLPMDEEYEIQQCMRELKEVFPDFEKHGRILNIEARNIDHDLPGGRAWATPAYLMRRETPVQNLLNVGDAVCTPGLFGTSGCAEGATRIVKSIKQKIKPGK